MLIALLGVRVQYVAKIYAACICRKSVPFYITSAGHNTALLHGSNKLPLGWVNFALFSNFMKSHGLAVPPGTIW